MSVFPDLRQEAERASVDRETGAGLADVMRSVRALARESRQIVTDAGEVLDREVAMAISISERLRDETLSPEILKEARSGRLTSAARGNAHRIIDLLADTGGAATVVALRFVERIADEPRRPAASGSLVGSEPIVVAAAAEMGAGV